MIAYSVTKRKQIFVWCATSRQPPPTSRRPARCRASPTARVVGHGLAPLPGPIPRPRAQHPSPWGEGGSPPALSPAGARRVRGQFAAFYAIACIASLTSRTNSSGLSPAASRALARCGKNPPTCHSERSPGPDGPERREESRSAYSQRSARLLAVPIRSGLPGMTRRLGLSHRLPWGGRLEFPCVWRGREDSNCG
jgi:hypothetical protein